MLNTSSVSKRVKEQQAKQASSSAIIMVKSFSIVSGSCLLAKHFELKKKILIIMKGSGFLRRPRNLTKYPS